MTEKRTTSTRMTAFLLALALVLALALAQMPAVLADEPVYVLMNIPYDEFYAAELGADDAPVDAVTSATFNKPRTGTLAGGSYHVNADGSDITGVIYPVLVTDKAVLADLTEITDASSVEITVTNRGNTSTTTYAGKDALFEAPSHAYYRLTEAPARYKTLSVEESGSFSFSAVSGEATAVDGVTANASYYTHHNNYVEIALSGLTFEENVSGAVATLADGSRIGLKHIEGIWRKTQIGWAAPDQIAGKRIQNVTFITPENVYSCDVDIAVKQALGEVTAAFRDANTIIVTGLPEDMKNPVATVKTSVGRGEEATVIADGVAVTDGSIVTTVPACEKAADGGTEPQPYAISITSDNYADVNITAEFDLSEGEGFLAQIIGDYRPLFEGATLNREYDHYWHDYAAAVVGATAADDAVANIKASINAQGYGAQADAPNFFCGFAGGVTAITFGGEDGKTVTYTKEDGSSTVIHYTFVKEASATGIYAGFEMAMDGYLYEAQEADAGMFKYLLMFPDTPDTTFHLEFRYGETEADVCSLLEGPCGCWVGAAIAASALAEEDEDTLQKVISLFVVENLAEMINDETEAQRAGLVGTWDCDFSAFPQYGSAQMYIVLSANGDGKTYADFTGSGSMALTAEYTFFAYDADDSDGKDSGTYIALNPAEETVTPGYYEITAVNGRKALVFTSNEGVITYLSRTEQRFEDVTDENAYYYDAVYWAVGSGITKGTGETAFSPNANCTRAQMVTFLWRAAGMPEPTAADLTFDDVSQSAYYYKAVLWAAENGITRGTGDTTFSPDANCTRAQTVTFLWRAAGEPEPTAADLHFKDVAPGAYYGKAVLWAAENDITRGTGDTTFSPEAHCLRAQIVTFLHRAYGGE